MPDLSMVHVDDALTNVSIQYQNNDFVADKVFPYYPVNKKSDKYFVFDKTRFRPVDDARGVGAEANEMFGWNLSTDFYDAEGHALKDYVPDEIRGNADPATDIDVTTTEQLTDVILLNREIAMVNTLFGAGSSVPNTTLAGTSQWSDYQNSDPILAIDQQKEVVQQAVGKRPNVIATSRPVFRTLRNHPRIIDRLKYVKDARSLTAQDMADAFEVDEFIVGEALQNTVTEGQADSLSYIWGKNLLLFYRPPAVGKKVVALGAHFTWNYGVPMNKGYLVKRWREEKRTADAIEVQLYYSQKVIAAAAGFAFLAAVA